jgi:tight adherence protein C
LTMLFSIIIYVVVFLALFLLVFLVIQKSSEESARRALGIQTKSKVVKSPIIKILRPAFSLYLPLARAIQPDEQRRKRRYQFVLAGMSEEMMPDEFLAYQMLTGSIAAGFMLLFNRGGSIFVSLAVVASGFFFPYKWLLDRIKIRMNSMVRELPHVVDMLALSTRAGLGFMAGLDRLTKNRPSTPLMEELTILLQEIQMGSTRQNALRNMANRCDSPELNQFIIVLIQASSLGVPISRVLRAQSEKMRSERFQKAERMGAAATQKILFPMIFIIMPAVFIVVLGPMLITFFLS